MGKIRVQDLARMMGVENQDLIFKLKSIGVRVDGDEAAIDTANIQAILEGKRLAAPREVILRDDSPAAKQAANAAVRAGVRKTPGQLRPVRRSMIQRVESRIRDIEIKERPVPKAAEPVVEPDEALAAMVSTDEAPAPEPEIPAEVAAPPAAAAELPPPVEVPPKVEAEVEAPKAEATKPKVEAPKAEAAKPEAEAKPEPKAEAPKAEAAKPKPEAPKAEAAKPPVEAKPAVKVEKVADKAAKVADKAAKVADRAAAPKAADKAAKVADKAAAAKVADKAAKVAGKAKPAPKARPADQESRRRRPVKKRPEPRQLARLISRPSKPEEVVARKPVSERGRRRARRRQDEPVRAAGGILQFKEDRPDGPVTISEGMTVREFAEKLGVKAKDLIKALVARGIMANINHVLDVATATSLAEQLGVETMEVTFEEEVQLRHEVVVDASKQPRAPVVTVMGHVDHGKTTLLDAIRSTKVAQGEAGGITQHIGAYGVEIDGKKIVFLDTPGHEAFTMMRSRGARATDIVVLVVAADDGVMPQTVEAIDHAKAAGVPIIVAVNKIDKANANLDRVRKELSEHGLMVEDWGGDTVSVSISALRAEGISDLLEMILITTDLLELIAAPELPARGVVLEARKEIGRGIVATILVQDGTLHPSDIFVAGSTWGRVRLMSDDRGQRLVEAGPATPVEVTGFTEVPAAGDVFQVMADESKARSIAQLRRDEDRQRDLAPQPGRMSLEQLFSQMDQEEGKELSVVIKADVHGSVEVLRETLGKLSTEKVRLNVIHAAVGAITTNDVLLASASDAVVVGFNVRPERNVAPLAEKEQVDIRLHTVIYELSDELKRAMTGLLEPVFREIHAGTAEIRDTFKVPKIGVVAGCHIIDGLIPRSAGVRLLRDNRVVYEGKISSLKRFKDDVSEVRSGFDCGIGLEHFQDIKPGDSIEAFIREEVTPAL